MQIIGLCRFSYPAIGGFQVEHDSYEQRIAFLWAQERLEERFRLFETVTLPGLRAQNDQDFDLIVLIGDKLPKHHLERLRDLTATIPQIQIVTRPPINNREVCKALLNGARRDPGAPCLQFRMDDDDAVAVDFIEKARNATNAARLMLKGHKTVGLTWPAGFIAHFGPDGIAASEHYRPYNTAGLMMHVEGHCKLTIHNFMHERIPRRMPCISFPDEAMFVRSHNGYNDSRQKKVKPVPTAPLTAEQTALFQTRFAIDENHVRTVFSQP